MPERCTCGAQLPPDARFCHKCGKPQRDEPVIAELEQESARQIAQQQQQQYASAPPLLPTLQPAKIGFRNAMAVRIALFAGSLSLLASMLLGQLPGFQVLAVLAPAASGFFAVRLYRRRTGQRLTAAGGAHLGWISGIFGFAITAILVATFAGMLTQPDLAAAVREQAKMSRPEMLEAINEFSTPEGIAKALAATFVLFTLLPAFGGTLGATLLNRD